MNQDSSITNTDAIPAAITVDHDGDGTVSVALKGAWVLAAARPGVDAVEREFDVAGRAVTRVTLDGTALGHWDTGLLTFLTGVAEVCRDRGIPLETDALPEGARRLLELASSAPEHESESRPGRKSLVDRVGDATLGAAAGATEMFSFVGDVTIALGRMLTGRARMRFRDVALFVQEAGWEALPIVSLTSFLVGVILAFIGAIQLQLFGAQIFVADLVGVAMTREMGAMMTAIIMAGRTGAAYAAQLGTMTVNEEVDAFRTAGISPIEYLVLPRMIALVLMMPLLALYSDFVGMLGGAAVGVGMLDISLSQYIEHTRSAIGPMHFVLGLIKAAVYGVVVAYAGCYYGMRCGRSAAAVGSAVTSAVVMGILLIIISSAVTTVLYNRLGL